MTLYHVYVCLYTGVENVINFDFPPTPNDYVHRVGRYVLTVVLFPHTFNTWCGNAACIFLEGRSLIIFCLLSALVYTVRGIHLLCVLDVHKINAPFLIVPKHNLGL